ncbi:lymphocyte antigen 75-like [Mugil cephalus]|uniref:lymphocyte antigen 75-like n=1 Tax=Mugil cephalus TaxID=48193 RepID=UPI001FB5FA4A|nr:lymphocyte antigen 75-like [Mugil cephalus]
MGKKRIPELTLSLLLTAALCLGAKIQTLVYLPDVTLNWDDARQYCQREHVDLVTRTVVSVFPLVKVMTAAGVKIAWMGLHRRLDKPTVWKWVDLETGKGISGADLSWRSYWASMEKSNHCAYMADNLMWYSAPCSKAYPYYCSDGKRVEYHSFNRSWYNASWSCQEQGSYLATIDSSSKDYVAEGGWIGLYRKTEQDWSWVGNLSSRYRNWAPSHPFVEDCGYFSSTVKLWHSTKCDRELWFLCYDVNVVVVNENKTWEDALRHCRGMERTCAPYNGPCVKNFDLVSLTDPFEFRHIRRKIDRLTSTNEVWTGLRFLGGEWWWSNGEELDQDGALPDCPPQGEHCGVLSRKTNDLEIRDCAEKRNFVCSGEVEE